MVYTTLMTVKRKKIDKITYLRGPSPDGFHVPLSEEWQSVIDIWTALGGTELAAFQNALKIPFAGLRDYFDSGIVEQGADGHYWSSTPHPSGAFIFHLLIAPLPGGEISLGVENYSHADSIHIRCFKDYPVVPTSSWTKLYGTSIEAGGIFWNSTDGLISLSSDGQNWITMQDKNLGATIVYNSGDTLTEANMGNMYQRGNNYGFPSTGAISNTSRTQIDASAYGPANPYSSDTFIIRNNNWSSVQNNNLRGYESYINS